MRFAVLMSAMAVILGTAGCGPFATAFYMNSRSATADTPSHANDGPYRKTSNKYWVHKRDDLGLSKPSIMDEQRNPYVIDERKSYSRRR